MKAFLLRGNLLGRFASALFLLTLASNAAIASESGGNHLDAADHKDMAFIPAGVFTMGTNFHNNDSYNESNFAMNDANPAHRVYLDAFWIDKDDVTVRQYMHCVKAGKCQVPDKLEDQIKDSAVTYVNWFDAQNYCHFVGKQLPTEAQWEKAARGPKGYVNPWGNKPLKFGDGNGESGAPGSYSWDVSGYGVKHMGADWGQWVADWYGKYYYAHSPFKNPKGPRKGYVDKDVYLTPGRVIRGRGSNDYRTSYYSVRRESSTPNTPSDDVTFRCAMAGADAPLGRRKDAPITSPNQKQ